MSHRLSIAFCILVSCSLQSSPQPVPDGVRTVHDSVVPVFVRDATPSSEHGGSRDRGHARVNTRVERYRYRACTGVHVTPDLLLTSLATLPPADRHGVTMYDLNGAVFAGYPDRDRNRVTDLYEHDSIAVLRTEDSGMPLPLRERDARVGEHVHVEGYSFSEPRSRRGFAVPKAERYGAVVIDDVHDDLLGRRDTFTIRLAERKAIPSCGAAVVDDDGNLLGVVLWRSGDRVSVLTVRAIRTVIGQYLGSPP